MCELDEKVKGFLDCAQRGEISYDVVFQAGVNLGMNPKKMEELVKDSAEKRRKSLIVEEDDYIDEDD